MTDQFQRVIMLNVDYSPLEMIPWQRAVTLIVMGEAESIADEDAVIRSKNLTIPKPKTIRLLRYAVVKFHVIIDEHSQATMAQVMRRDKSRCGYCGEFAETVDHILPKSRGGLNTWGNLIAACFDCNQFKDDRTPEEAGMKLLWPPKAPESFNKSLQRTIWREIEAIKQPELMSIE